MKILVTGAKGMLGTELMKIIESSKNYEVLGIDISDLDLSDLKKSTEFICKFAPDCIVNCAAYTNVDNCEKEFETAFKANSIIPKNLAIISEQINAKLVHISTDYVFDGESKKPYIESDFVNPINVYGKSKLDGENNIRNLCNKFYILRTQWLFGEYGNNFVKNIILLSKDKPELKVVNDQFGSPTFTKDLCCVILNLLNTNDYGTYHITNKGVVSWYEFTKEIFKIANIKTKVEPCTSDEFKRAATRPKYSPMDNFNYKICGFDEIRDFREALKQYLEETNSLKS